MSECDWSSDVCSSDLSKEYEALKKLIKMEPLDNSKFWNVSIDQLISNNITVNIVIQGAGDVVLLSE